MKVQILPLEKFGFYEALSVNASRCHLPQRWRFVLNRYICEISFRYTSEQETLCVYLILLSADGFEGFEGFFGKVFFQTVFFLNGVGVLGDAFVAGG